MISNNRKATKVSLGLSRSHGSDGSRWRLEITDAESRVQIVEACFDDGTFADLMSHAHTGNTADAHVYVGDKIGKRHEAMTVAIAAKPGDDLTRIYDAAEAEHPGWAVDREQRWNMHRFNGGAYSVILRRWVEVTP